ncbi:Z1 domain-containing protein [Aeromonas caviae]|uniref:Z1 domain-containing protein n=1 Tax=Aeromonas caviae TaxID=648 RepID=UPI0029D55037|nr:Z1 domain-containing protein [Aeromonas caviae]MDX7680041.1 Z1 domain-containing protein [Aeromonas caviae]MDX7887407.1 Z1 domain-containing protein [Aeromonas caviae]
MTTSVSILSKIEPPLRWEPLRREFTEEFLQYKTKDPNGPSYDDLAQGENSVLQEAQRILGRCLPPTEPSGRETGLVVGYVQSGKTMSFETVISLARDNLYGMVIVFAGTKKNLREQSEERLTKDLGIDEGDNWCHFSNPARGVANQINDKLEGWKKRPSKKKAILITVLKQVSRLESLADVLGMLPLDKVPVLVIDDESDQASLNTNAAKIRAEKIYANARSAIYECICTVRDKIPHHSFLQYTATPQANLLLAQTDLLNPSFAELVTPGEAYTGGKSFFKENNQLVIDIPIQEVPSKTNTVTSVPKSLLSALRYFLLVAAQHAITKVRGKDRNRSMMVHPAMQTSSHKVYKEWMDKSLKTLTDYVEKQYQNNLTNIENLFRAEYGELKSTYPNLKSLPELIESMVEDVFGELNCVEVNGTPDAEKKVNWKSTNYWILVGGAKLDRGYTVEGLTITYMPRPLGKSPAADTLQQRARFFGYKKAYLGLCRVFVQDNVREAFTAYVDHEEFVRSALIANRGKPLRDWRRDFVLTALLKPTRPNVIGLGTRRIPVDGWLVPRALQRDKDAAIFNRKLLSTVEDSWKTRFGPALNVTQLERFKSATDLSSNYILENIPLRIVLEEFLLDIQVRDPLDAEEHSAMIIAIAELLRDNNSLTVDVFLINNLEAQYRTRSSGRGFSSEHENAPINQYFSNSADTINDRSFVSHNRVTLQLRRFNLGTLVRDKASADIHDVTWFALNVPKSLRKDLLIEERN